MSHRIFIAPTLLESVGANSSIEFELDTDTSHHLKNVIRLSEGAQIVVVDREAGREFIAIVVSLAKQAGVRIKIIRPLEKLIKYPVLKTLACGLPKGAHSDQICEQVTQLGISRIIFWAADRTVVKPKNIDSKIDRWRKIVESSAKQSQQNKIPEVLYFDSSIQFFSWIKDNHDLTKDFLGICSLNPEAKLINQVSVNKDAHLLIGPEGDFNDVEIASLDSLGAEHVSLGPSVLRVETAAVVATSMALAAWGWR